MATAQVAGVRKDVHLPGSTPRAGARRILHEGIGDVLDAAINWRGKTDLRRSIMSVVYSYETESFEIRWDLAK